jgi:hypothetical protein
VNPSHGRAVYLSVPIGLVEPAFNVAQRLNDCGASVFLDEPWILDKTFERRVAPQIPTAICYADELLVLLPDPKPAIPLSDALFPRRDFLVIALTVAHLRNMKTCVFLPPSVFPDTVLKSSDAPPFLNDADKFQETDRESFYERLRYDVSQPKVVKGLLQLKNPLRVCLYWISTDRHTTSSREAKQLSDRLTEYGLLPELVLLTKSRSGWEPSYNPRGDYDALAVCVHASEAGPWDENQDNEVRRLVEQVADLRRPVVVVQRGHTARPVQRPLYLQGRAQFELSAKAPATQILALVRGLIGFKDWRSGRTATPEPPHPMPAPTVAPGLEPLSPPTAVPPRHETVPLQPIPLSSLPPAKADVLFAMFCRIEGIKDMAADDQAVAADVLDSVVDSLRSDSVQVFNGPNGRIVLVRKVADALDLAVKLHGDCAAKGVQLAAGVATGRVAPTQDVTGSGIAGPVLNRAARLAHLNRGAGRTAVEEQAVHDATTGVSRYQKKFSSLKTGMVKRTELTFAWLNEKVPTLAALPRVNKHHEAELAHIVIYDMARYSELPRENLAPLANKLNTAARRALDAVGGDQWINGTGGWYIPAGDGGVLVFRMEKEGAALAAWTFVTRLLANAAAMLSRPVRIGVATGQVVARGQKLPVGVGIDEADALSAAALQDKPCVNRRFWLDTLDKDDRKGFRYKSIDVPKNALLVRQA